MSSLYSHQLQCGTAESLKEQIRLLWEQHVYWTRLTIVGIVFDLPDLNFTVQRLLRNADDFAAAFKPFYGESVSSAFGALIRDHLTIAAQLVQAAKAGDAQAAADAEKRWYQNADQIVAFLNAINCYWPAACMKPMWYEHLALTKSKNWR